MININTILSTFDEQGTLLKWLKTTNDALKNASLKSVETVQPTPTTLQLKFIFADESSLLSPPIILPKGDPLFFETENTLDTLSPEEATAFDLLIKKSFLEKRPIVAICPESNFYQLQAIGDGSNTYFIGAISNRSQFEIVTFYKNETWSFEYGIVLNYTSEFLWNFSSGNINYQINAHVVSINNDLILKQNDLSPEVKMNYIYNFFLNNMISSLSLEFNNKWHKIVEITFENQTDYTFYYLENGVIKSELIDASIIL